MSNLRVLICGSRHFHDYHRFVQQCFDLGARDWDVIIHGGAKGADTLAHIFAFNHGKRVERYPADWNTYGKRAGPIRNYQMLKEGRPELVVAFIAPNSRGTKHMVEISRKTGIEVKEINIG